MKKELQSKLLEKYPEFFEYLKEHEGPIIPIQFGFECHDGWYWLIDTLMDTISSYCKNNEVESINIIQIKEKYSSLRFYYSGGDTMIDGMVWLAEHQSYHICEFCGTTENIGYTEGWVYTICEKCHKEGEDNVKGLEWNPK